MQSFTQRALIGVLGLFFLGLILGQIFVPIMAEDTAHQFPEVRHLVLPYSILGIATLACFQIAATLLAGILWRSSKGSFFSDATRTLIVATGAACTVGFLIPAATAIHLLATIHAGGPGVVLGLAASLIAAIGFAGLTYIATRAFDSARFDHEELGGVI